MAKRVIKYDPQATFNGIAGEAIAEGELCGIADTNGSIFKADADATQGTGATNKAVGFAVKAAAVGAMVALAPICTLDGLTSQTVGGLLYLSATAGATTQTKPVTNTFTQQIVGTARSATEALCQVHAPLQYQTAGNSTLTSY